MPPLRAVNSIYSQNDFVSRYVCCCWMCLHAGDVEVFGVNDSVGERIRVFSVGNVEFIFKNWFRLSMRRPSSLSIHALSLESKSVARFDTLH